MGQGLYGEKMPPTPPAGHGLGFSNTF
jgi:hypothetical protein